MYSVCWARTITQANSSEEWQMWDWVGHKLSRPAGIIVSSIDTYNSGQQ